MKEQGSWFSCLLLFLSLWSLEHSSLRTTRVSIYSCPCPQCPLLCIPSALDRGGGLFSFSFFPYSFLRLRCRDKVLGGKPNSRLQGGRFLSLTETTPKQKRIEKKGKQKACRSGSYRPSLGSILFQLLKMGDGQGGQSHSLSWHRSVSALGRSGGEQLSRCWPLADAGSQVGRYPLSHADQH